MNKKCINIFFQLLRFSIGASTDCPINISSEDWEDIYEIAQQQSLLGIIFYGIVKEPEIKPEKRLFMKWCAMNDTIEQTNQKANRMAVKITKVLQKRGFRTCVLKGQGNTLNYPAPYIRMSGDIDIWLEGGFNKIMAFVKKQWPGLLLRKHHVVIPTKHDVVVEIHITPSYIYMPWMNRRLQSWFKDHAEEQFSNVVDLPENVGSICVPTFDFNLIYMLHHMFRHLFSEGIGLRQMLDYYFLITKENRCVERTAIKEQLSYLGLWKFARAVMYILQTVFGLEERLLIAEPDREEGEFLLNEILIGGNFGKYDTRLGSKENEGILHRYFRMTVRNMRYVTHYPAEALFEPIFRSWKALNRLL